MFKTIGTGNALYHTRTKEEYKRLMEQLEEHGCMWWSRQLPTWRPGAWDVNKSDTYIRVRHKLISCMGTSYREHSENRDLYAVGDNQHDY